MKVRRLIGERVVSVWAETELDPDEQPLSWKGFCDDVDAALDRMTGQITDDPMIKHLSGTDGVTVEIASTEEMDLR